MFQYEYKKRVRYGETDKMGYLYHGRYADLYEIGRTEMLRSLGTTYLEMEEVDKVMLPVASIQMRFIRPARYDEMLIIRTTLHHMPDKDMSFRVEIFNEANKLVNGGSVRLVFVDMVTMKTIPAPDFFKARLLPYFPEG
ncbi:MAG: acyl-CoA thioesterase [Bacteroidetes bacterium]|nr:acyl-CoA thioesterase [Bacteroidota bacterium]